MATIDNYKIKISVDGQEKLDQVITDAENADKAFSELSSTVDKFGKVTAGAFALIAGSAFKMADGLADVADATGLSIGTVGALAESIEQAGGKFDDVGKLVNTFYKNLEEGANNQASKAAESLRKLGIGLTELQTLSEQQLLTKALDQLAQMEAGAARTALGVEIFGKAFASIDPNKLQQIFATKDIDALNQELQSAADFIGAMESNFRALQKAAISALTPLTGEIKDFRLTAEQANTVIKTLGGILLTIYGAKTIAGVAQFIKVMKDLNVVLKAQAILQASIAALSGPAGWARAAGAIALVAGATYGLNKLLEDSTEQVKELNTETEKTKGAFAEATGFTEEQIKKREQEVKIAKEQTRQMIERNNEANKYQRILNGTIGLSEQQATMIKAMAEIERDGANEKLAIQKQLDAEIAKGNETNALTVIELKRQLSELEKQLGIRKQLKREELASLEQLKTIGYELKTLNRAEDIQKEIDYLDAVNAAEKQIGDKRQYALENAKDSYELYKNTLPIIRQISEESLALAEGSEARVGLEKELRDFAADTQLTVLRALTGQVNEEQKLLELQKRRQEILAYIDGLSGNLTDEQRKQVNELLKVLELETTRNTLLQGTNSEYAKTKDILQGTLDALDDISKQFTPYQMAQDAVLAGWNKIGSAIDNFVETGKFKFSDFARSVIADFAKMIIKAQIFKALQATLGFFGLPGLAEGGPAKAGQPYIVGEKGPELFVPKSAGTVIPNNKLAMASASTGSDNMVSAPITNNYITNTINALDAKSVAQLFAENRKALLGSVRTAEKELPYRA